MKIERRFTKGPDHDPYAGIEWEERKSEIRNPDGKVVFSHGKVTVPSSWSQIASDILAHKYFRKTGVPGEGGANDGEHDARQVFHRLAHTWKAWGKRAGYFNSEADAEAFYDEMRYMLARQMGAPNSPQWFNTGLYDVYGITGPAQGHHYVDHVTGELKEAGSAYERPQPHACFILNIEDNLVNDDGILSLVTREARLFKYGSGTGSNFSKIRAEGEPLSGGGVSSGLLSFLKTADRSASAIKSGGTTRRAAKMVILDTDHPDIERFIAWKDDEEYKVAAMVTGSAVLARYGERLLEAIDAPGEQAGFELPLEERANPLKNAKLRGVVIEAVHDGVPAQWLYQLLKMASEGEDPGTIRRFTVDWQDEAYNTISGQSSNNSVRVTDEFMRSVVDDRDWELIGRIDHTVRKSLKARKLWKEIARASWKCADPGIQFHTTINEWHTCSADGEIRGSNPCSEYMFLDNTACNLASLNLLRFYDEVSGTFQVEDYVHAIRLWTLVLEISVVMAQFPSESIARRSYEYRTLGLGYANLGTLLMVMGIPYDSPEGRSIAGALTAILSGEAYAESARLAAEVGPFPRYEANREAMLNVIRNHRRAAYNVPNDEYSGLSVYPEGLRGDSCPDFLLKAAREAWDRAVELGEKHGFRNAQVTAIAPTGTIGLVMDCDTTGVEPDFALVKFKKLAGGGYFKIINHSIPPALRRLGYDEQDTDAIIRYCVGNGTLKGAPGVSADSLKAKGFTDETLAAVDKALVNSVSLSAAFGPYTLGNEFLTESLGIPEVTYTLPGFDLLRHLGYTEADIEEAELYACGAMNMEGAPRLRPEDLTVFDTANPAGRKGTRSIPWPAHIDMMAAIQPFVSGAISKTINMPASATIADVEGAHMMAWKKMLKSIALYRDGSKLSQPLSSLMPGADPLADALLLASRQRVEEADPTGALGAQPTPDSGAVAAAAPSTATLSSAESVQNGEPAAIAREGASPQSMGAVSTGLNGFRTTEKRDDSKAGSGAPERKRKSLPTRRSGYTQKAKIGGHSLFLRTGEYGDGSLGEIFLDMYKEGAAFRSLLNSFAMAISLGLQYGVPLEEFVDAFTFTRFEPNGVVRGHENIKMTTSVLDFVFRDLALTYLKRTDLGQVQSEDLLTTGTGNHSRTANDASENEKAAVNGGPDDSSFSVMRDETRERAAMPKGRAEGADPQVKAVRQARIQGYEGDPCPSCGHFTLVRNGTCMKCETCGTTTGCS